jgi:hypothetical protein
LTDRELANGPGQAGSQLRIEKGDLARPRKQPDLASGEIADMGDKGLTQGGGFGIGHGYLGRVDISGPLSLHASD